METKNYCMSAYLTFRYIPDPEMNFFPELKHKQYKDIPDRVVCHSAEDIDRVITEKIEAKLISDKTAIFLSGGIDSAILASYLPAGTKAYTFRCVAGDAPNEVFEAKFFADINKLDLEVLDISWEDHLKITPDLLRFNQVPVHSIEIRLAKAAQYAKAKGYELIIIGEQADLIYGGMNKLLEKDWVFDDFVKRYTFTDPKKVLKNPVSMRHVFERFKKGEGVDVEEFLLNIFSFESSSSYMHAFDYAKMNYLDPYAYTVMGGKLDLDKVKSGEPKYLVRDLFRLRYPKVPIPDKIPMLRATDAWLKDWKGPVREEFIPGCVEGLTGDQKWQVYCLELFLNIFDS